MSCWSTCRRCDFQLSHILATNVNKTDRNDARSIAKAIRCKNYKEVHIKSIQAVQLNSLLTARKAIVHQKTTLHNTTRGILKTFGIKLPSGIKSLRKAIAEATAFDNYLPEEKRQARHVDWEVIEALIVCHESIDAQLELLDAKLNDHKGDPVSDLQLERCSHLKCLSYYFAPPKKDGRQARNLAD